MAAKIMVIDATKELRSTVRFLRAKGYSTIPEYESAGKNKILKQDMAFGKGLIGKYIDERLQKNGDVRIIVCGGCEDVVSGEAIVGHIMKNTAYKGYIIYRPDSLADEFISKILGYRNIEICLKGEENNTYLLEKIKRFLSR